MAEGRTASSTLSKDFLDKEKQNSVLYIGAIFISQIGTTIYTFAIGLHVLKVTGSGMSFAATLALGIFSMVLVTPFAGVLADKLDKKRLLIVSDLFNALVMFVLYLLTTASGPSLVAIYASTFLLNVFTTVYGITAESAKPHLVSSRRLLTLNAASKVAESGSSILGPVAGGMVYGFLDIRTFILVNGLSFALSAVAHLPMKFRNNEKQASKTALSPLPTPLPTPTPTSAVQIHFRQEIQEGIAYMAGKRSLVRLFAVFVLLNFLIGLAINVPLPFIVNQVLRLAPAEFGIIQGAFPVGMILGALATKAVMDRLPYEGIIRGSSLMMALCMLMIGLVAAGGDCFKGSSGAFLPILAVVMLLAGIAIAWIDIPLFSVLQSSIPAAYLGRVLSVGVTVAKAMLPLALLISGALINRFAPWVLPVAGSVLLALYALFFMKPSAVGIQEEFEIKYEEEQNENFN